MKAKNFILAVLISLSVSFLSPFIFNSITSAKTIQTFSYQKPDYKYEIVIIDGVKWMFVYNEDGELVDTYVVHE